MATNTSLRIETTIIIRTKNEGEFLQECLDAIKMQKYQKYEIIMVDSGSTDNTIEIIKKNKLKLIKISPEDFTFGYSLNIGCENSKGKYLVFISAHAIPINNEWLSKLIFGLTQNELITGVFSKQQPMKNAYNIVKRNYNKTYSIKNSTQNILFSNASSAIKKRNWEQHKFNEQLTGSEDYLWAKEEKNKGNQIKYINDSLIYHSHNENFKQIINRRFRESIANFKINKQNPGIKFLIFRFIAFIKNIILDIYYFLICTDNFYNFKKSLSHHLGMFLSDIKTYIYFLKNINL